MSAALLDLTVSMPGSKLPMRLLCSSPGALEGVAQGAPLTLVADGGQIVKVVNEPLLQRIYPKRWSAAQRAIDDVEAESAYREVLAARDGGAFDEESTSLFVAAEAALLEAQAEVDSEAYAAALAGMMLIAIQLRLRSLTD